MTADILVVVPEVLAPHFGSSKEQSVPPDGIDDVRGVLDALAAKYPVFNRRIRDDRGALRRFVNCYVNGEDVRFLAGLRSAVGPGDEVMVIQSVAGG